MLLDDSCLTCSERTACSSACAHAQFETEIRAERQMDGIQKAKERGVHFGRKKALNKKQVKELKAKRKKGKLIKNFMAEYGLSKASVFCHSQSLRMAKKNSLVTGKKIISSSMQEIRGSIVMIDRDLATLYGVKAIALRQQVKRNIERFPDDFMFRLSREEVDDLVSQNVIPSIKSLGGSMPYAFTQEGVAMLSSVLRSEKAIQINIEIMRVFVKMRQMLASHKELTRKIQYIERKVNKNDEEIGSIFKIIKDLILQPG